MKSLKNYFFILFKSVDYIKFMIYNKSIVEILKKQKEQKRARKGEREK